MKNKIKKIIAGIGVATTLVAGVFLYPIDPSMDFNLQEWQMLGAIYDYEVKQMGVAQFENVVISSETNKSNIYEKLNKKIRERKPTERIRIKDKEVSPEDYELLREDLMSRVEKTNLLKKIIR